MPPWSASGLERDGEVPWAEPIRMAREALARQNVGAAVRAWEAAHLAAVGSARWEGLVDVGDTYLRIGDASGARQSAESTARRAYFAALFRACQQDSFEGVLRVAAAFADLGDRQVVEECAGLADLLAADDRDQARLRAVVGLR